MVYRHIMTESIIRAFILRKLVRTGCWGGRHTSIDNLPKGLPSHLRGDAKQVCKELVKEGFLLAKPTAYGTEVSLNPARKAEIEKIVEASE